MVKKKVLIIGGCGYIGTRLCGHLDEKYEVSTIDTEWFGNFCNPNNSIKDMNLITDRDITEQDVVILLAGHSSVKMCEDNMMSTLKNNVVNFAGLLEKLDNDQIFIYASSSSVYGDTGAKIVDENYSMFRPNNFYDLTKHEIDSYAELSNKTYFGLRFGTVNGYSPNLRNDIMINAMTYNALENKKIFCFNPEVNRPILGISDLCRAVVTIIEKGDRSSRGMYNLASFNSNAKDIASGVAKVTGAELVISDKPPEIITNVKLQAKAYDFLINSDKFKNQFDFDFEETVESITRSLVDNFSSMNMGNRSDVKLY
jgi:nucleoside-diphosphate-sugar epimerase